MKQPGSATLTVAKRKQVKLLFENEECFSQIRFTCSEDRRYQHRLWEMQYNCQRPHQGIGNQTPLQVYKEQYPLHAGSRML